MIKGGSSQLYTQLKAVVKLKPEKEKKFRPERDNSI